jgi:hypothetical protein
MLYQRDFRKLNEQEQTAYDKAKEMEASTEEFDAENFFTLHEMMPIAAYYFESLFPNNYLSIEELAKPAPFHTKLDGYKQLIENPASGERDILNYIKNNEAYFIIASMLKKGFDFGHHDAYIFKEFSLPPYFKADYLIIGKNSGGHEFVFVELESVYGQITNNDGALGTCFRAGIKQTEDWDAYIEANFQTISLLFDQAKMPGINLAQEFLKLDKSRIHYAVIAGRRADFNDKTRRIKRKTRDDRKIHLLHYDNLIDTSNSLIKDGSY